MNRKNEGFVIKAAADFIHIWNEAKLTGHTASRLRPKKNQWQWSEVPKGWVNMLYLPQLIEWRSHGLSFIISSSAGRNGLRNGVRYHNELWSVPFITTFSTQNWKWMHPGVDGKPRSFDTDTSKKNLLTGEGCCICKQLVRALIGPWTGTGKCWGGQLMVFTIRSIPLAPGVVWLNVGSAAIKIQNNQCQTLIT